MDGATRMYNLLKLLLTPQKGLVVFVFWLQLREVVLLHTGGPMEITVQRGARAERVLLSFSA